MFWQSEALENVHSPLAPVLIKSLHAVQALSAAGLPESVEHRAFDWKHPGRGVAQVLQYRIPSSPVELEKTIAFIGW